MSASRGQAWLPSRLAADPPRRRVGRRFFERLYRDADDPWAFATSEYEREKYAHSLSVLDGRRFDRTLEIGCSIGVFTAQLATISAEVIAIDVSSRALERARQRLRGQPGVSVARMAFPEAMPGGLWGLVVCSEVLYYLDHIAFEAALERLRIALENGATVLAVHWRGPTKTYPLCGDEVHDRLLSEFGAWHSLDDRRPQYRLDRFDAH